MKSVMEPTQKSEFLDLIINSLDMTLPLTAEKLEKVQRQCLSLLGKKTTSLLELTKLLVFCHHDSSSDACSIAVLVSPKTTNFNDKKGMLY